MKRDATFSLSSGTRLPLALCGLLVLEALALSLLFDAEPLRRRLPTVWGSVFSNAGLLIPVGLTLLFAGLLFGERVLDVEIRRQWSERRFRPAFLAAHLVAFAFCLWFSSRVFGSGIERTEFPGLQLLAWLVSLAASLVFWALTLFPAAALQGLLRRACRPLLAGLLVSVAALAVGQALLIAWNPLGPSTVELAHRLLALVVDDPVYVPSSRLLGTARFTVEIAPICSGYQGIGLMWVFLSAYLWLFRAHLRFPHALLLFPIGTGLIWAANVVRVAGLVAVGDLISPEIAVGGFHSHAGWLFFCVVAAVVILGSRRLRWFGAEAASTTSEPAGGGSTVAYLGPFLALLATALVTGMFVIDFDWLYPVRVLVVAAALWTFRRHYRELRPTGSLAAVSIGLVVAGLWIGARGLDGSFAIADETAQKLAGMSGLLAVPWVFGRMLGAALLVPVAEELAFRGYLLRRLIAPDFEEVDPQRFSMLSFLGSSVAYGLLHGHWVAGTAAGMLFAVAVYRRGRLQDAILAHVIANAAIAVYVLATGDWSAWH